MPLALPSGWFDTGITASSTASASAHIEMAGTGGVLPPAADPWAAPPNRNMIKLFLAEWELAGVQYAAMLPSPPNPPGTFLVTNQAWVRSTTLGVSATKLQEETLTGTGSAFDLASEAGPFAFTRTIGPLRLGRRRVPNYITTPQPVFAQLHMDDEYIFFGDENTTLQTSFGGVSITRYLNGFGFWQSTPAAAFTPVQFGILIGGITFGAYVINGPSSVQQARITGLVAGDNSDTAGLDSGCLIAAGSGAVNANSRNGSVSTLETIYPTTNVRFRIEPSTYYRNESDRAAFTGKATDNWLTVAQGGRSPDYSELQLPFDQTVASPNQSWTHPTAKSAPSTVGPFQLTNFTPAGWLEPPADDLILALWCNPGKAAPSGWPLFFEPMEITFASETQILNTSGGWVSENPAVLTGSGVATFVASAASAAYVRKQIGASGTDTPIWRRWLGVGASGKSDPLFNPDLSETTKHAAGEDVWDWTQYGWLRAEGTFSHPGGTSCKLRVEGVFLAITDNHETGSSRGTAFTVAATPYTAEYSIPLSGPQLFELDIDLLFPDKVDGATWSGPFYHGRIDAIAFGEFEQGQVTFAKFALVARGDVHLKVGYGPPVQRGDYSSLGMSNGGAFPAGVLGDESNKPPEDGDSPLSGGYLRYVTILTGSGTGLILDVQLGLQAFLEKLSALEGWSTVWTQSVVDAQNIDTYGVTLDTPLAQCAVPAIPDVKFAAGSSYRPSCHWIANRVRVTNGIAYVVGTYQCVGAAITALPQADTGRRIPAGTDFQADGFSASQRQSDAQGYVRVYPVPPSSSAAVGISAL